MPKNDASAPDPMSAPELIEENVGLPLPGQERVLVVNCGSSSLKYSLFDTRERGHCVRGQVERIGARGTRLVQGQLTRELPAGDYPAAFGAMATALSEAEELSGSNDLTLVVHRVVHGGERFVEPTLITEDVLRQLEMINTLAPLHNPVNLAGIRALRGLFPKVRQMAVFDTAFHHTLRPEAFLYGLPYECYENMTVRRYGFHGMSHAYVTLRAAQTLGRPASDLRLVSCHLGNGSSVCAIKHGRSFDTSMGFTPGEGLIMGTRCGDLDAGVVTFLEREQGLTPDQIDELLNEKSGLRGLSGISGDMREVMAAAGQGHRRSLLAVEAYCYRLRKYIGAYVAALGGVDAVIFTGGIGQGSAEVRWRGVTGLSCMGVHLDEQRNRDARGFEVICRISAEDSPVVVLVVPTDEERMMAFEALRTQHVAQGRPTASRPAPP